MNNNPPQIALYLDMDGVLVDFDKRVRQIYPKFDELVPHYHAGTKHENHKQLYTNMVFRIIRDKTFWTNLDWTHDGQQLWKFVSHKFNIENIGILTTPMKQDEKCEQQKIEWVQRELNGAIPVSRTFLAHNKEDFIGRIPGKYQILIDDKPSNINHWNKAGGIGILHHNASGSISKLESIIRDIRDRA